MQINSEEIFKKKKGLRKRYLDLRKALSKDSVENRSEKLIGNLGKLIGPEVKSILFYIPIMNEVDLLPLAKDLFLQKKMILFPSLVEKKDVVPRIVEDLYFDFKPGAYNIPEPATKPYFKSIELALIPGVVFGRDGNRIGYGKGYFDRFLKKTRINKIIGICFDFQIAEDIPHTENDYPVDMIVTEKSIIIPEKYREK